MLYGILISSLLVATVLYDLFPWKQISRSHSLVYYLFLLAFICVAGFRWRVGGDTFNYQYVFENEIPTIGRVLDFYSVSTKLWEPSFIGLMSISKTVLDKFWFFQLIHAVVVNVIVFSFIRRECKAKFVALTIYFFFQYLYFNMEILRESLAICIFLLSYRYYRDRKWANYYFGVIVASSFHVSAIITLFAPLFRNMRMSKSGIFVLIAFFILTQALNPFLGMVVPLLSNDFVVDRLLTYSLMRFNLIGVLYNLALFCLLPGIVVHFFRKHMGTKFEGILYFYFVIAIFFLALNGFGRFINYLTPFIIVYASSAIFFILNKGRETLVSILLILAFSFLPIYTKLSYYLTDTSKLVGGTRLYNLWLPYYTIFTKQEYRNRELLYDRYMEDGLQRVFDQVD